VVRRPQIRGRSRWLISVLLPGLLVWVALGVGTTDAEAQRRRRKRSRPRPAPAAPAPRPEPARDTPDVDAGADAGPEPGRSDPGRGEPRGGDGKGGKAKVFDFTGLDISGRLRAPQLLYFLERANEELERASLERRSFIPEMMRTLDEEQL
jgi:hypothetical protein